MARIEEIVNGYFTSESISLDHCTKDELILYCDDLRDRLREINQWAWESLPANYYDEFADFRRKQEDEHPNP